MKKPLIVYLDSSDYSVFSDDSARTQEIINIENQLLQLRDEGKIEIRFSHINIIEAAPIRIENRLSSAKRLQKIKQFCGFKCLTSYVLLVENEIDFLKKNKPSANHSEALNDDGIWFPSLVDPSEFSYSSDYFKEEISKIPDRKSRRIAKRKLYNKDGSVKNIGVSLKGSAESFAREICSKYPFTEESAKIAAESYFNKGSSASFARLLSDSLSNLENISKWYESSWDEATQLSSFMREIGEDLLSSQEQIKNHSIKLKEKYILSGLNDEQIKIEMDEMFDGLLTSIPKSLVQRQNENKAIDFSQKIYCELCPSLSTLTTLSVQLAKFNSSTNRKPKTSDFGDILHTTYLPYVDIFRVDGNKASIIKQAKLPFKTKIVSKITDLPYEINNLLMLELNNSINYK